MGTVEDGNVIGRVALQDDSSGGNGSVSLESECDR